MIKATRSNLKNSRGHIVNGGKGDEPASAAQWLEFDKVVSKSKKLPNEIFKKIGFTD